MGTWNDLPAELAAIILRALDDEPRDERPHTVRPYVNKNIIHCTYVSHQFHNLTMPIFYREVNIEAEYTRQDDPLRQIRRLTRTIVSRPQLGKFIKALKIPCLPNDKYRSNTTYSNLSHADVESILETETAEVSADLWILLDAAARSKLPNELIIKSELVGEFFLLLHQSPRLQTLRVTMSDDLRTIALSSLGDFVGGVPAGLQSMSELSIFYDWCSDMTDIIPFMMFPSLTSFTARGHLQPEHAPKWLRIEGLDESNPILSSSNLDKGTEPLCSLHGKNVSTRSGVIKTPSGYTLMPKSSSITDLDLDMRNLSGMLLSRVLILPTSLERLRCRASAAFVSVQVLPGLQAQTESLKELTIGLEHGCYPRHDGSTIGSLTRFHSLERLVISVTMILGIKRPVSDITVTQNPLDDLLPPHLVVLELEVDRGWTGDLVQLLKATGIPKTLTATTQRIPTLRKVVIHCSNYNKDQTIRNAALAEQLRIRPQIALEFKVRINHIISASVLSLFPSAVIQPAEHWAPRLLEHYIQVNLDRWRCYCQMRAKCIRRLRNLGFVNLT